MTPSASKRGFSVRIFIAQGDPTGLKVIEKSNWTGVGLVMSRATFPEQRSRQVIRTSIPGPARPTFSG